MAIGPRAATASPRSAPTPSSGAGLPLGPIKGSALARAALTRRRRAAAFVPATDQLPVRGWLFVALEEVGLRVESKSCRGDNGEY